MFETADWQKKAVSEVGDEGGNAVIEIRLPLATTGGAFALIVNNEATAAIPYNASASTVQTALEALGTVEVGNVAVSGLKKGPYTIELRGELAGQPVPEGYFLADGSLLVPNALLTPKIVRQGRAVSMLTTSIQLWGNYSGLRSDELRYLHVKRDLLRAEVARYALMVDSRDGDAESKDSQRFANLSRMLRDVANDILTADQLSGVVARNQTYDATPDKTTPNGLPFGQLRPGGFGGFNGSGALDARTDCLDGGDGERSQRWRAAS